MAGEHSTTDVRRGLRAPRQGGPRPPRRRAWCRCSRRRRPRGQLPRRPQGQVAAEARRRRVLEILGMRFLEGGPFTDDDDREARAVAVINARTRDRFFGRRQASGRPSTSPGRRCAWSESSRTSRSCGSLICADVYAPIGTIPGTRGAARCRANFVAMILARSPRRLPGAAGRAPVAGEAAPHSRPEDATRRSMPRPTRCSESRRASIVNEPSEDDGRPGLSASAKLASSWPSRRCCS